MRRGLAWRAAAGGLAGLFLFLELPHLYLIKNFLVDLLWFTPWGGY